MNCVKERDFFSIAKILLLIIIAGMLFACESKEKMPEGVVPKDEFVDILLDVQILEATFKQKSMPDSTRKKLMAENYATLFKKHNITPSLFKFSYDAWASRPDDMIEILNAVAEKTNQLENDLRAQNPDH